MVGTEGGIAGLFNRMFHLRLHWTSTSNQTRTVSVVSDGDIKELHDLCSQLLPDLKDEKILRAIWSMRQMRVAIDRCFDFPGTMELFKHKTTRIAGFPERIQKSDWDTFFALFCTVEEKILHDAGLDQGTIAIIMARLREKQSQIVTNARSPKGVQEDKYLRSIDTLNNSVGRLYQKTDKRPVSEKSLLLAKDKIIGLATIWADAYPLVVSRDWGVASVLSSVAGATVACILPGGRGSNE